MNLTEQLAAVKDEMTFLAFARALLRDRQAESGSTDHCGRGTQGWENHTIDTFLEASLQWAEATGMGRSQGLSDDNPWKKMATFLYLGKIYE